MEYIVDELFLKEYKRMFERYADHLSWCDIVSSRSIASGPESDYARCTCGFSLDVKNLREQENKNVKVKEESEMNTPNIDRVRWEYVDEIDALPFDDQIRHMKQLLVDLMCLHEQTDEEKIFVDLHKMLDDRYPNLHPYS